jgi:hypothetical protein
VKGGLRQVGELLAKSAVKAEAMAPLVPASDLVRRRGRRRFGMSLAEARSIAGSLGHPSKMPGYSYGLDAKRCHRGRVMALMPGSICAGCFALNGFYATWRPALVARERRHAGLEHPLWVDAMVRMINHYCRPAPTVDLAALHTIDLHDAEADIRGVPYFRWHDSGDLQGVWHLRNIVAVCERTPEVRHWLPTREYEMVAEFLDAGGVIPANLCIRLSALMIDSEPPWMLEGIEVRPGTTIIPAGLANLPTSTVHTPGAGSPVTGKGAIECRAVELRENQCGSCRACWDVRVRNVSYPEH